jgi:hypothetical protein
MKLHSLTIRQFDLINGDDNDDDDDAKDLIIASFLPMFSQNEIVESFRVLQRFARKNACQRNIMLRK